ncbi:MAG: chemotaxis protein CheC [Thermotogaceae bacterium]|nr:chemotaxis protein CheC [Thermotogaceae bacterium]
MQLTEEQLDLLKEIGNIGAGNAATALSTLTGKKVDITVPSAKYVSISDIPFLFDSPEEIVVGIRMTIKRDLIMDILLILDAKTTKMILFSLMNAECKNITQLDPMSESALREIGNIMCGSYITAMAEFTNSYLDPSPPELITDMLTGIVSEAMLSTAEYEDNAVFVETSLSVEKLEKIKAHLFLIPGIGTLNEIFGKMGLM